jgi:hypothetical protein
MSTTEVVHGEHIIAARCTVCGFSVCVARVSGPDLDTSLPHICVEDGLFVHRVDGQAYVLL